MKTVLTLLEARFRQAIGKALGLDADPVITLAQQEKFGDYQSNAAMGLAKQIAAAAGEKANPRATAEKIKAVLDLGEMAQEVSIAGPGFINVRLSTDWLAKQLQQLAPDARLGVEAAASPVRAVVDYSCPNIAKEMHVGHLRSTIIGDALSRVIEFLGHDVIRQNHIGDWGTQFGMLLAHLKTSGQDADSHIQDLQAFYREAQERFKEDPAFQDLARENVVRLQAGEPEQLAMWKKIVDESRRHYQPIYERLGVMLKAEDERGESFYNPYLADVVKELLEKGIAQESEGAIAVFVEGFDAPLIIQKSGGGYLYATTDLAAIRYRTTELGAKRVLYTTDSRQSQHFAQVFATAREAGWAESVSLEHAPFGMMLGEDGRPFKARSGESVRLKDLLDEAVDRAYVLVSEKNPELPEEQRRAIAQSVGIGAVKYSDLSKDRIGDYVFSFDKMLALNGNTAPYMQYAYARICSIVRKAGTEADVSSRVILGTPHEIALAKHLLRFGDVIDLVQRELKPHYLCMYLYELATQFSGFYENCPVLQSEEPVRASRLLLAEITARTMAAGLDLLGIEHPEQM